jgi:hypothetical protein
MVGENGSNPRLLYNNVTQKILKSHPSPTLGLGILRPEPCHLFTDIGLWTKQDPGEPSTKDEKILLW